MELREYDHGKATESAKASESKKFAKFKTQMESALVLIHQIQVNTATYLYFIFSHLRNVLTLH